MAEDNADLLKYLKENKDSLISEWEAAVREKVPAASDADALVLRDHVPLILDDLEAAWREIGPNAGPREAGSRGFSPVRSADHGRHRASTESYSIEQVLHEFIILRHVLTDRLRKETPSGADAIEMVNRVLELCMLESGAAFSSALSHLQQKVVGMLAHDVRTPIAIAYSSMELLKSGSLDERETEEVLRTAQGGLKRSMDMLSELLDSITIRAGEGILMQFKETDYKGELEKACEGIKLVYGDRLKTELPNAPIEAVFCPSSIRRLLENLVSNGEKHGAPGRLITISCEDCGEEVAVSVHNEGKPIPDDEQRRIFQFLKRATGSTHSRDDSWGMGLTLVKVVAEAHKGSVRIESGEGKGTRFLVRLNKRPREPGDTRASLNPGENG